MNKFLLIVIFLLFSCTPNIPKNDFVFSDQMSFDEFKSKLENYAKNKPYPNIDD